MKSLLLILVSVFMLASCASAPKQAAWPDDIPPYSFYVDEYNSDIDNKSQQDLSSYLKWVVGFYQGTDFYSGGWHHTITEAIEGIDDAAQKKLVHTKLQWIGQQVSAEWAKLNKYRVINTRHVSIWALSLNESIARGEALVYIDEVVRDVDAILAGRIEPEDITDYRYFAESEDFFF